MRDIMTKTITKQAVKAATKKSSTITRAASKAAVKKTMAKIGRASCRERVLRLV